MIKGKKQTPETLPESTVSETEQQEPEVKWTPKAVIELFRNYRGIQELLDKHIDAQDKENITEVARWYDTYYQVIKKLIEDINESCPDLVFSDFPKKKYKEPYTGLIELGEFFEKPIKEQSSERKEVEIDLNDFSSVPGTQLLKDLILSPNGVTYQERLHGKNQPKSLRQTLKGKYPEIAQDLHIKKNLIYLETINLKVKN